MEPKFIVIAGVVDRAGNDACTVLKYLPKRTGENNILQTREPGGTPFAEKLRTLLHEDSATSVPEIERHLIWALRIDHEAQIIRPALERGEHVICDSLGYTLLARHEMAPGESSLLHAAFGREQLVGKPTLFIIFTHKDADERVSMAFRNVARALNTGFLPWKTEVVYIDATDPIEASQKLRDVVAHHLEKELAVAG